MVLSAAECPVRKSPLIFVLIVAGSGLYNEKIKIKNKDNNNAFPTRIKLYYISFLRIKCMAEKEIIKEKLIENVSLTKIIPPQNYEYVKKKRNKMLTTYLTPTIYVINCTS